MQINSNNRKDKNSPIPWQKLTTEDVVWELSLDPPSDEPTGLPSRRCRDQHRRRQLLRQKFLVRKLSRRKLSRRKLSRRKLLRRKLSRRRHRQTTLCRRHFPSNFSWRCRRIWPTLVCRRASVFLLLSERWVSGRSSEVSVSAAESIFRMNVFSEKKSERRNWGRQSRWQKPQREGRLEHLKWNEIKLIWKHNNRTKSEVTFKVLFTLEFE